MDIKSLLELFRKSPELFLDTSGRSGAKTYCYQDYYLKIGSSLIAYSEQYALSKQVSAITVNSGLERRRAHEFYKKNDYYKKGYSFIKKCE